MPLSPPLTAIIDTVTGSVTEIGRIYLRTLGELVGDRAPITAAYWLSRSDGTLSAEQNLGALASGYLKLAVALGIGTPSTVPTIPQADITGLAASLAGFAPLASPALTGTPTAPTAAAGTTTTQLATTAFVQAANGLTGASAFHNTTQSLPTATWTVLNLNAEDFDSGTLHDVTTNNSRVGAPATGTYLVIAQTFHAAAGGTLRGFALQKNAAGVGFANVVAADARANDATNGNFMTLPTIVALAAGDYLELAAYQDSGVNQTVGSATRRNASVLQLVRLA
jgi:hypothetical protein